jgi:pimeloyl-ACP methyl ester carboxylesterase
MRGSRRRLVSFALVTAVIALVLPVPVVARAPSVPAAPTFSAPAATWEPCFEDVDTGYECDVVRAPLDYGDPTGPTVSVAMARIKATDPAHRIGSLFINPGGPGGSGVDFLVGAGKFLFTDEVRAKFDIVGFDPRGITRSRPLTCFTSSDEWGPYFTPFSFPITERQTQRWEEADRYLDRNCRDRAGPILDHMSTADTARDMDLLRQAVGDDKLTYYGVSYGSFLGQVYANLFPNHFRALVIDGVLDPIAWTTGKPGQRDLPFSTRLHSDMGAQATLDEFFRLCDAGPKNCAFAGHSARRYQAIAQRLIDHPLIIEDPHGGRTRFLYQDLIGISLGSLYGSAGWVDFAGFLHQIDSLAGPAKIGAAYQRLRHTIGFDQRFPENPPYRNDIEGFPGVACSDSDNPSTYARWTEAGANASELYGYFGRLWTWVSSICAEWPGHDADRYMGPFDTATGKPVLVVGNLFDPATRYQGAKIAHDLLPNSALLTVHGWGHTSLFKSLCADEAIAAYLIHGTTPPAGTVCEQDDVPFTGGPSAAVRSSAELSAQRQVIARLIPEQVARTHH